MLLYFWKHGCAPCEKLKPVAERIAEETGLAVTYVNIEDDPAQTLAYQVRAVPTLVVTKADGTRVAGFVGTLINPIVVKRAVELAQ